MHFAVDTERGTEHDNRTGAYAKFAERFQAVRDHLEKEEQTNRFGSATCLAASFAALLARAYNCHDLKHSALIYISTRAMAAMRSPHWNRLTALPRPAEGVALIDEVMYVVAQGTPMKDGRAIGRGKKRPLQLLNLRFSVPDWGGL